MVLWLPLGVLAQEAEVFPLPDAPPLEDVQIDTRQDEDEVNIPTLPGTTAVDPPRAASAPDARNRDLRELPRSAPARTEALRTSAIGEDQLQRFVQAYREIESIHARYARLMPAADEMERQSLAQGGNAEMRTAIQQAGLTVAQYNAISLQRWQDAAFSKTLNDMLAQKR